MIVHVQCESVSTSWLSPYVRFRKVCNKNFSSIYIPHHKIISVTVTLTVN